MQSDINQDLIKAIKEHNVMNVRKSIQHGADPNYTWKISSEDNLDLSSLQPTTPLSLLIFVISNCVLNEEDLSQYYEIAKILLENNADPEPAMLVAKQRYGMYKEPKKPSIFADIYHLVYKAYSKIQLAKTKKNL